MKFFAVLLIAAGVSANIFACEEQQNAIPKCSEDCINNAAVNICGPADFKCMCGKDSDIRPKAEACVTSKCGAGTADTVNKSVAAFCKCIAK